MNRRELLIGAGAAGVAAYTGLPAVAASRPTVADLVAMYPPKRKGELDSVIGHHPLTNSQSYTIYVFSGLSAMCLTAWSGLPSCRRVRTMLSIFTDITMGFGGWCDDTGASARVCGDGGSII